MAFNLLLAATVIYAGFQLRSAWVAAKAREAARLHAPQPAVPAPVIPAAPKPPSVVATSYIDVAQKDLFEKDRNPNVIKEIPAPPPPPPLPPPLPAYHGMMNLGDKEGPLLIMSKSGSAQQEEVHRGEMIGEFKLIAFDRNEITLEWNGQTIKKSTDEFSRLGGNNSSAAAAGAPAFSVPTAANPTPNAPIVTADKGPGETRGATRACQPGDSAAPGTVQDGYVKVVRPGPFGSACFWEPAK